MPRVYGLPLYQKVINLLRDYPLKKFTAREIAVLIIKEYPDDFQDKRQGFDTEADFIQQVSFEVMGRKEVILKNEPHIFLQDNPRPRIYWYDPNKTQSLNLDNDYTEVTEDFMEETVEVKPAHPQSLTEQQLYPLLVEYLKVELKLFCLRIDEKRSKNQRGNGGNQWLHPDIVAMQPVDKEWHELVRTCVQRGGGQTVRLWSFEVKKELNISNVRMSFFQAVSNSSWANEGYLVATSLANNVEQELRMLSALHGIGVILLNPQNPCESEILLPAIARPEVDWQSVNRIVLENEDFKSFVELVSTYYQTGRIIGQWNKV